MSLIYNKTNWKDDKTTPVNARNLNNIEDGVEYIYHKWDKIIRDSTTGDHAAELIDARYGPNDVEQHPTLGHRLNHIQGDISYLDFNKLNKSDLPYVNVIDFGAKGDGITDDTLAIQKAIEYIESIGEGNVHIPRGKYIISKTLSVSKFIQITGDGCTSNPSLDDAKGTILIKQFRGPGIMLKSRAIIKDLAVYGMGGGFILNDDGIVLGCIEDSIFKVASSTELSNVMSVRNGGDGIRLALANCCKLDKIFCDFNYGNGLNLESDENVPYGEVNENLVVLTATGNSGYGLRINRSYTNKCNQVIVQGNGKSGIYVNAPYQFINFYTEDNGPKGSKVGVIGGNSGFGCVLQGKVVENKVELSNSNVTFFQYNEPGNLTNSFSMGGRYGIEHTLSRASTYSNFTTIINPGEDYTYRVTTIYGCSINNSTINMNPRKKLPSGLGFYVYPLETDVVGLVIYNYSTKPISLESIEWNCLGFTVKPVR